MSLFWLERPFLRTARALIDVYREEMILHDGDEILTLNMRHDTSSYLNQPQKESINMINIYDDSCEDFLEDLFATNHQSGSPTFSSHTDLTSPEVKDNIFDPERDIVLDSTKDLHPPHNINLLSGNDDLPFDIESDLKEIEYLLNHNPIKEIDSILENLVDEHNLADLNDNLVDTIPEMFIDEHAVDYSSPPLCDEYDDDLYEFESSDFLPSPEYDSYLFEDFSEADALPSTNNKDENVNGKNSCGKNQKANISVKEIQKKYQPNVSKPKKEGSRESLATPKPRKSGLLLRWSPTGRLFNQEGNLKLLINFIWKFMGTIRFENDHVAAILGFGQFYNSDLEVAFRRNACFVRNLEGVDLLKGDHSTNLYTINLHKMASASPICLMACASSTKSWLWHQRLSHLNFKTINDLARNDLVERYVLVIVDDYSRYTWIHFLRSKDEAPEVIIKFLKRISVLLQSPVIIIRTDNGTEFKNQVLKKYFDTVGISHQMSSVRTPQQNRVVERRNQTLVEAARTIKQDISFLQVFGALCYPKNDREDTGKLSAKGDISFFIGYSADSCAYRVYNRRTKKIMETMNVLFDELSAMAFEQRSSKPGLQ
nr:hypothetical protein [Tanacetum cinerariifolium]